MNTLKVPSVDFAAPAAPPDVEALVADAWARKPVEAPDAPPVEAPDAPPVEAPDAPPVEVESPFAEAMREEGLDADEYDQVESLVAIEPALAIGSADQRPAPVAEVRMMAPPGPSKAVRVDRVTYVGVEGRIVRLPREHRAELLLSNWIDAA